MKRLTILLALFGAVALCSCSKNEKYPDDHPIITAFKDVGLKVESVVVPFYQCSIVVETGYVNYSQPALLPVPIHYNKKKFVSHDRKRNRQRTQLFGRSSTSTEAASYIHVDKPIDPGLPEEVWQWLASNTKDQS